MKDKNLFSLLILCLVSTSVIAQRSAEPNKSQLMKEFVNRDSKWGLFMNTLSVLEPQQAAVGAGVNYKIAERWDISVEINYLFEGFWQGGDSYKIKGGYRGIITGKRFAKNGIFFYGIDARIKHYSFVDKRSFTNAATGDTLFNFSHNANNTLIGAACIVGFRLPISKNKKWDFEINTGVGWKYRFVERKNIPTGYSYYRPDFRPKSYDFTSGQDVNSSDNIYFPTAIRVLYLF